MPLSSVAIGVLLLHWPEAEDATRRVQSACQRRLDGAHIRSAIERFPAKIDRLCVGAREPGERLPRLRSDIRIRSAGERIDCPVDGPRGHKISLQLVGWNLKYVGKRAEPCIDQLILVKARKGFRLRAAEPAGEQRCFVRKLRPL